MKVSKNAGWCGEYYSIELPFQSTKAFSLCPDCRKKIGIRKDVVGDIWKNIGLGKLLLIAYKRKMGNMEGGYE